MEIGAIPVGGCAKHRKMCEYRSCIIIPTMVENAIDLEPPRRIHGEYEVSGHWIGVPHSWRVSHLWSAVIRWVIHLIWDPHPCNWSSRFVHLPFQVCMRGDPVNKPDLAEKKYVPSGTLLNFWQILPGEQCSVHLPVIGSGWLILVPNE